MRSVVIVLFIILVGVGGYYFFTQQNKPSESTMRKQESAIMDKTDSSRYVEYSKEALEKSKDKRRVLFFYANWCSECRPADDNFQENSIQIPEDVVVIRVNYNDTDTDTEEKALAERYGITYQHTFVQIDAEGDEIAKWNGGQIEELLKNIK